MIIQGIGVWLPEKKRLNSYWPESFGKIDENTRANDVVAGDRTFSDLEGASDEGIARAMEPFLRAESQDPFLGVKERRVADPGETVARSTGIAARNALEDAGLCPADVDVVLGMAGVPDYLPGQVASSVAKEIGCPDGLLAFDFNAGCATGIVGLELAQKIIGDDHRKVVLLVVSNLFTRFNPVMHPVAPSFGDGASAFVLTSRPYGLMVRSIVAHTHPDLSNSIAFLRSKDPSEPKWFEQSNRPLYLGTRETSKVRTIISETISYTVQTVKEAAAKAGIEETKDLDYLVCTQPRGFIPVISAQFLGMPRDAAIQTYEVLGHMHAVSVMMNLFEAKQRGLLKKSGTKIGLCSQGVGFIRAAAILEVVPPPKLRSSL